MRAAVIAAALLTLLACSHPIQAVREWFEGMRADAPHSESQENTDESTHG